MAVKSVFVRTPYNYDRDVVSRGTGFTDDTPSLTVQSEKDNCDINTIVRRFALTKEMPVGMVPPTYGDFDQVFDFHTAMNAVAEAREKFDQMPAHIRATFQNDPQHFVEFASDPKNIDKMREWGLAIPAALEDTVSEVEPVVKSVKESGDAKSG